MDTIKSSDRIGKIFSEGRRVGTPELSLIALQDDELHDRQGRVAFIAGKKLGNAVWRNHAKRRMRAVCHEMGQLPTSFDVVFLARKNVTEADFSDMLMRAKKAMAKLESKYE